MQPSILIVPIPRFVGRCVPAHFVSRVKRTVVKATQHHPLLRQIQRARLIIVHGQGLPPPSEKAKAIWVQFRRIQANGNQLIISDAMHAFFCGGKRHPGPIRQHTARRPISCDSMASPEGDDPSTAVKRTNSPNCRRGIPRGIPSTSNGLSIHGKRRPRCGTWISISNANRANPNRPHSRAPKPPRNATPPHLAKRPTIGLLPNLRCTSSPSLCHAFTRPLWSKTSRHDKSNRPPQIEPHFVQRPAKPIPHKRNHVKPSENTPKTGQRTLLCEQTGTTTLELKARITHFRTEHGHHLFCERHTHKGASYCVASVREGAGWNAMAVLKHQNPRHAHGFSVTLKVQHPATS